MGKLSRIVKAAFNEATKPESFAKGEEFEQYVRDFIFTSKDYELKHRSHDYTDNKGDYIETSLAPDFIMISKKTKKEFCLEIKFRSNFYGNAVEWCKDYQLKRYKEYDKKRPVFILLGVEGKAKYPENLYLFPVRNVKYSKLFRSVLEKYKIFLDKPYPEYMLWKLLNNVGK